MCLKLYPCVWNLSISGDTTEFTLDPGTGIVRVNTELDYETQQEYRIRVQATDGGFQNISLCLY